MFNATRGCDKKGSEKESEKSSLRGKLKNPASMQNQLDEKLLELTSPKIKKGFFV